MHDPWRDLPALPDRPLTVEDLEPLPDDGRRYELADGRLEVFYAGTAMHSFAATRLCFHLTMNEPEGYETLPRVPFVMDARRTCFRAPDVSVRSTDRELEDYPTDPPLLAVEVTTAESVLRDHHAKFREYAAFGIPSYWIVTPCQWAPNIIEFRLENNGYRPVRKVDGTDVFETDLPFPVKLVPHWLVASGPWKRHIGGEPEEAQGVHR
ncbi:Uma2 family endonuclease [Nocardiopsis dassonvillei]|uniref:Uma2 family endonuclease n=1 Tax=Nocardiopsis dassonvillei TaxID=2014 RepID=UPI0033D0E0E2